MPDDQTEQKEFAASSRKLRKMREKGQFARSRDLTNLVPTLAAVIYILIIFPYMTEAIFALFENGLLALSDGLTTQTISTLAQIFQTILIMSVMVFLVVFLASLLTSGVMASGIRFAMDPITPKFEKINPAKGVKRVFGKKALFEFLLNALKVLLLVGVLVGMHLVFWGELVFLPRHQLGAIASIAELFLILLAVLFGIMIFIALIDYIIQRAVFMENARMTRTEKKQETKEQEGNPEQRNRRKAIAKENFERPTGVPLATFSVQHGHILLAFRYVEGETNVPFLVGKATSHESVQEMVKILPRRAAKIKDPLAVKLAKTQLGYSVTKEEIHELAGLMSKNGLY